MFGTLRSADRNRDSFEFIENPDPVAAVSRNVQDKARIACLLCRSKKVRCSGGRNGCDRCAALGETCRYADQNNNTVNKPKRNSTRERRSVISPKAAICTRVDTQSSNDAEDEQQYDSLTMENIETTVFNAALESSLLPPWSIGSPNQLCHGAGGVDTAITDLRDEYPFDFSSPNFTALSRRAITPLLSSSPSVLLSSTPRTDSINPESLATTGVDNGGIPWAVPYEQLDSAPATRPTSTQASREPSVIPDSCSCLVRSVSLLERLAARSALHENRFDVLLSDVRYSIETMAAFIGCVRCVTRAGQNMLVAVTARQVGLVCKKMARCYKDMCDRESGAGNYDASEQEAGNSRIDISIATYHVTSRERHHLLENLMRMQMSELQQILGTIKLRYHNCSDHGHEEALQEADRHIEAASAAIKTTLS